MRIRRSVLTVVLGGLILMGVARAYAQDAYVLLTPAERRAYHACLYDVWVHHYCQENARAVAACIVANGGGKFPVNNGWLRFPDDYCWTAAQGVTSTK